MLVSLAFMSLTCMFCKTHFRCCVEIKYVQIQSFLRIQFHSQTSEKLMNTRKFFIKGLQTFFMKKSPILTGLHFNFRTTNFSDIRMDGTIKYVTNRY